MLHLPCRGFVFFMFRHTIKARMFKIIHNACMIRLANNNFCGSFLASHRCHNAIDYFYFTKDVVIDTPKVINL